MSKQGTRSRPRGSDSVVKEAPLIGLVKQHTPKAKKQQTVKSNNSGGTQKGFVRNKRKCRWLKSPSGQRSHTDVIPDICTSADILAWNHTDLANSMANHTKTKQHCSSAKKVYIVDTEQAELSESCVPVAEQTGLLQNIHLFHTPDVAVIDVDNQDTSRSQHILADNTSVSCVFKSFSNSNYEQKSAKYLKSVKYRKKTEDKVNKYASRSLQRNRIKLASNCAEGLTEKKNSLTPEVIIQERLTCQNCNGRTKNEEEKRKCDCFQHFSSHEEVTAVGVENYQNKECDIARKSDFCGPFANTAEDVISNDNSENNISINLTEDGSTKESFSESEGKVTDQENEKLTKAAKVHLHPISAELRAKYGLYETDSPDKKGIVERKQTFKNSREIHKHFKDKENVIDLTNATEDDMAISDVKKEKSSLTDRKTDASELKCTMQKKKTRQLSRVKPSVKSKEFKNAKETKPFSCRTSKQKTTFRSSRKSSKSKSTVSSEKLSKKSGLVCDILNVIQKQADIQLESGHNNGEGKIDCSNTDGFLSHDTVSQQTHLQTMAEETSDSPTVSEDMDTTEVVIAKGAFKMKIKYSDKKKKIKKKLQYKDTCKLKGLVGENVDRNHQITKTASNEKTKGMKNGLEDDIVSNQFSQKKTFKTKKHNIFKENEYRRKRKGKSETDISSKINCLKTVESDKSDPRIKKRTSHTLDKLSDTFKKRANQKDSSHEKTSRSTKENVDQVQVTCCEENDIVVNHLSKPSTGSVSPERIALLKKQLQIKRRHLTAVLDLNKCLSEPCDLECGILSQSNDASSIVCDGLNVNNSVTDLNHENSKQKTDGVDKNQEDPISQKLNLSVDSQTSDGVHCNLMNTSYVSEIAATKVDGSDVNEKVSQALGAGFLIEPSDCDDVTNLSVDRNIVPDCSLSESTLVCGQLSTEHSKIQAKDGLKQPTTLNAIVINQKSVKSSFHPVDCQNNCSMVEGNNSMPFIGNTNQQTEVRRCQEQIPKDLNQGAPSAKNFCQKREKVSATKENTVNGFMNLKDTVVDFEQARKYGLTFSDDSGEEDDYREDIEIELGPDVRNSSINKCISLLKGNTQSIEMCARTKCANPLKNDVSLLDAVHLSPKLECRKNDKIVQDAGIKDHTSCRRSFDETDSVSVDDTNIVSVSPDRKTGAGTYSLSPNYVSVIYDTIKGLQHELETDQYDETHLAASSENESSVLALPVNYPLAQLFKEKMEAEENEKLNQSKPVNTIASDNQLEMHQCKTCNKRFRNYALLEMHQTSSCISNMEDSLDIETSGMASTNQKLQVLDGTEKNEEIIALLNRKSSVCSPDRNNKEIIAVLNRKLSVCSPDRKNKEIIALLNRKLSVCSPDRKPRLRNVEAEIVRSNSQQILPAEEIVVISSDTVKESISSGMRKVEKRVKKNDKSDERERKRSGGSSGNVRKDDFDLIEENEVDKSETEVMECPLCKEVMRKNDFFCHKLSCIPSPQSQNTGLDDLTSESNTGQIEYSTSSLNQQNTEGSSKVPFINYGSHLSESDSLSDTSHASRSDLKIVLTKVKMCNLIMNGTTLKFCGSVNKPLWKIKDTKKKKRKDKPVSVSKIIEEDDSKLERPEGAAVQTEMELNTGLNNGMCDSRKTDIQHHETCKTPTKDKCEIQGLNIPYTSQKTVKKSNTKKPMKLKENLSGPDKSANSSITDFEKQLLVIDQPKIRVKEKTKKKHRVQSSTRERSKKNPEIEVIDQSLVKVVKEPPEHFMRSKIAQKIFERDKAQVYNDGLPDFSKYGGQLDMLPPLVVESSVSEINNNKSMCKSKENVSINDLISNTDKTSNMIQKEGEEIMENIENVPKERSKHTDKMDDLRKIAPKRTYSSIYAEPFYSQYKMPKFEFNNTRYTNSASPVAFYSSDNMSSNDLDNSSDNPNSSQVLSEDSEISSIEDIDSFTMTDLDVQSYNVIGNSTPSSTANVNIGVTAYRPTNCSSVYINQDPWHTFIDSHKQDTPQNSFSHWQSSTVQRGVLSSTPFVGDKPKANENLCDIFELSGISSIHEKSETPPKRQRIKRYEITKEDQQDEIPDGDRRVVVCKDRGLSSIRKKVEDPEIEKQSQETSKRKSWRKKQTKSATLDNMINTRKETDRATIEVEGSKSKYELPKLVSDQGNKEKVSPFDKEEKASSLYNRKEVSASHYIRNLVCTLDDKEKVCTFSEIEADSSLDNREVSTFVNEEKISNNEEKEIEMRQTDDCDTNHESETNNLETEPENYKVESDKHTGIDKTIEEEMNAGDLRGENILQDQDSLHSKEDNDVDDDLVDMESIEDSQQETDEVRNNLGNDIDKESGNNSGIDSDMESNDKNINEKEPDAMSEESKGKGEDVEAISESKTAKEVTQFELNEITDDVLYLSDPDMDMFLEEECQFNEDEDGTSSREQSPVIDNPTSRENYSDGRNECLGSVGRRSSDRDSLDSEDAVEKDQTKSEGIRKLRWMPRGYCFNFFNNRWCTKNPCTYQHNYPPSNIIVQSFKEHLDRNDDEICLDILRSHGNVYGNIPNLYLETLYRRLCSNVESFWLLKIMNHKGMLDQIIVDNYIRNFAHIKYTEYLYEVFEMAKGNNIQLQEDVMLKLLKVFSSQESLLEKLIAIMIYSTEDENFLVPVEYVSVAVNGVLKMPKLSNQLLPWLLNTKQLLQLHSDLVERLCEELEKNGVRKDITTRIKDVLKQLKKGAGTNEHMMEESLWTEEDESLWKDNVKIVKYTKDFKHLAELYDERTRDMKLTEEECCLFINVIGEDRSKVDQAFDVFLENVTCKSSSLRGSPVVFGDPLAAIAYGVFELCYNDQLFPMCVGILATMRACGVSLSCDQFVLRAVKVHLATSQSQLVLDIVKDVNFDTMDWLMQEELIRCFHDLVGQLGQQGLIMECLTVVQWAFKLVYNCAPNVTEREAFINLPQICNGLINVFLNQNFFKLAVDVYWLIQKYGQHFPGNAQLEQKLMVGLFETECKPIALNIYEKLKRLKFYKQQEFNIPRKIAIPCHNLLNLGLELVIIVEDYLMSLYNLLCDNVLSNQLPSHRDLHLRIVFLSSMNQTSMLNDAKTVLETKLNPPLQSSIEYGYIIVAPESLQNYLTHLDMKGRGQGLKFDAKPGSRNFQYTRKQRR